MTFGAPGRDELVDWRGVALLLIGAAGLAACVTWVFLGMRAVMDIGGACADGGPYVPVQSCPAGVPLLMTFGIFGLFGFGGLTAWGGGRVGGGWVALPLLAWPGLFLSLGWNFLEYGFAPPADLVPEGEWEWGWIIPGVIFVLMGGVPLVLAWTSRSAIRAEGGGDALARRFGMPGAGPASTARPMGRPVPRPTTADSQRSAAAETRSAARPPAPAETRPVTGQALAMDDRGADIVDRLERLAALHRDGSLSAAQFEAAKRVLLGDEPS